MELFSAKFKAMGSPCALFLYAETASAISVAENKVIEMLDGWEMKYSRYQSDSALSQINQQAGTSARFRLDDEFWQLVQYANTAYEISDGLFDITSGVLREVWHRNTQEIPSQQTIEACLKRIGWDKVAMQKKNFHLPLPGMQIDLGGIVKEFAADAIANQLLNMGYTSGLIDLGGDITVLGAKPSGEPWNIAISHPQAPESAIATIPMISGGLASSGDYQRFIEIDGERYCHIVNPKTGWPTKGLAGVSVFTEQCVVAGTLSTIAMLKGAEGLSWLRQLGCQFVAIDESMKVHTS
ncbi:FAD:protein FMN transferase [Glaciecola sp. KUL10]|uniref:FAD:protein FMN transferase n=1 Tax=Glaciecola sp. (strain KUL10) TaxID=2161813 RepID=UPI000D78895C|nr:FAD:protein FMN transferase [Glaciecola sp. KUL10]GBL03626.1 thiamine biosynthesis lipoprotein ApbE [Glaciecola sp. KUL10]